MSRAADGREQVTPTATGLYRIIAVNDYAKPLLLMFCNTASNHLILNVFDRMHKQSHRAPRNYKPASPLLCISQHHHQTAQCSC
ncbi:unnamed protein product [Urochloa humidicola]